MVKEENEDVFNTKLGRENIEIMKSWKELAYKLHGGHGGIKRRLVQLLKEDLEKNGN